VFLIFEDGAVVILLPNGLLEGAVKFHGHLGPFLILGLRAGLIGTDYLGKNYFELKATVETSPNPPRSCFIDGIQFTSGCTVGKGNIEIKASNDVYVEFVRGNRKISLMIRDAILDALALISSEKQADTASREALQKTDEELFLIKKD
jgi:formylmethanofuran dehydrogenase subunit E